MFDAFARNCDDINQELPAIAEIPYSYDNAFLHDRRMFCLIYIYIVLLSIMFLYIGG